MKSWAFARVNDMDTDVLIIGAGLLGCFSALHLSAYDLKITVIEKENDAASGLSKANTGIVYSGLDAKSGTLKSAMNVRANASFEKLCASLGVRFSRCGSLLVSFGERGDKVVERKFENGLANGVPGLHILDNNEILEIEPNINGSVKKALLAGTTGTVNPWELCIAAYECAAANGAEFIFNQELLSLKRSGGGFIAETFDKTYHAKAVINCAGLSSDRIRELCEAPEIRLYPTASDYLVLDTTSGGLVNHVIFHEPEEKGKGLTLVPTVDGNILVGPTKRKAAGYDGFPTEKEGFEELKKLCSFVVPGLDMSTVIRSFGSLRPSPCYVHEENGQVVRGERDISGFTFLEENGLFSMIGIKTPGMTCANELGEYAANKAVCHLGGAVKKSDFRFERKPIERVSELTYEERKSFIEKAPDYGALICRCRHVSEGEVKEAIARGAKDVQGVKYRTGTCTGRCQGAYCRTKVEEALRCAAGNGPGPFNLDSRIGSSGCAGRPHRAAPTDHYDILIIGAGAAGMGAAVSAMKNGARKVCVVERKDAPGGVLSQCVHHGFGLGYFKEDLTGQEYAGRIIKDFLSCGAELLTGTMVTDISPDRTAVLSSRGCLRTVSFEQCILATGCRERTIESLPTAGTRPACGVMTAGRAQQLLNCYNADIGDDFLILGTGDIGQIVARQLIQQGKNVIAMVEQNEAPGGILRNRRECIEQYNIPVILHSTITKIYGEKRITGAEIIDLHSGSGQFWRCGTLITALGLIPERDLISPLTADGALPSWLCLSGNCDYVHEIVDTVSLDAEIIGGNTARKLSRLPQQA